MCARTSVQSSSEFLVLIAHFTLTFHTHISHSHCTLTLHTHIAHSHFTHCTLTLHTHFSHSHCTLTFHTHIARSHFTLTFSSAHCTLTFHTHFSHSHFHVHMIKVLKLQGLTESQWQLAFEILKLQHFNHRSDCSVQCVNGSRKDCFHLCMWYLGKQFVCTLRAVPLCGGTSL